MEQLIQGQLEYDEWPLENIKSVSFATFYLKYFLGLPVLLQINITEWRIWDENQIQSETRTIVQYADPPAGDYDITIMISGVRTRRPPMLTFSIR